MINREDQDQLIAASAAGRVLYTFNVADYCLPHQSWMVQGRDHCGIIVSLQQRYPVGEELRRLMRLIARVTSDEMCNRVEFLSSWA